MDVADGAVGLMRAADHLADWPDAAPHQCASGVEINTPGGDATSAADLPPLVAGAGVTPVAPAYTPDSDPDTTSPQPR